MTKVDLNRLNLQWTKGDCPCGSGWTKHGVFDSKNIFLTSGCESCLPNKLKGYREDVLYGPDYDTLEGELG